MANLKQDASHLKACSDKTWTDVQAYLLAAVCLVLGVALGYLFRGSAAPVAGAVQASAATDGSAPQDQLSQGQPGQGQPNQAQPNQSQPAQPQLSPEQQKAMVDQAVAPLLATFKTRPDDFNTITQLANLYYDGRQYPEAVKYYRLAVKIQPTNADVLTDLGTSLWFLGDADGAITAIPKSDKLEYSEVTLVPGPDFSIKKLSIKGQDGSVIRYAFDGEIRNPPLSDSLFKFIKPPGAVMLDPARGNQ